MPTGDRERRHTPQVLLLGIVTLLAVASGVASLARQVAQLGPDVGDIVTFKPDQMSRSDSNARVTADRLRQGNCVLDVSIMKRSGGSLVVEQRGAATDQIYHAHWAGSRTSEDVTDCGSEADLVLSRADMTTLALAAVGPGADQTDGLRLR
jgi:hypothetical protein